MIKKISSYIYWKARQVRALASDAFSAPFSYLHPDIGLFVYHPKDFIAHHLYTCGASYHYERAELSLLKELVKDASVAVDVGANIGIYSVLLARYMKAGRVYAFEPAPKTFAKLQLTLSMLKTKNVIPIQRAVSSSAGVMDFFVSSNGLDAIQGSIKHEGGFAKISVQTIRLDDAIEDPQNVSFLKIDVEGDEISVLEGSKKILRNGRVKVLIEFNRSYLNHPGSSADQLWNMLSETHRCTLLFQNHRTVTSPVGKPDFDNIDLCNTLWVPKGV